MMRKNSDKKTGAIASAAVIIAILAILICVFILLISAIHSLIVRCFLILYTVVLLAVAAGILVALIQHLKESNAEAEEAKKY